MPIIIFEVYKTVHDALKPFVRINYERLFDACNSNTNRPGQLAIIRPPFLLLKLLDALIAKTCTLVIPRCNTTS